MLRKIASVCRQSCCDRSGFTLVELMIVIIIVGIMSGLAIPEFFATSRRNTFGGIANRVAILFNQARTQALASELDDDLKAPPGGYGIFVSAALQKAVLFIDNFHYDCGLSSCRVNMNYANEDIAQRVSPDGIYTSGSDTVLESITLNEQTYMRLSMLTGKKEDDSIWSGSANASVTIIFTPPYAETSIVALDGPDEIILKELEMKFDLLTENIFRKIKFNRITTTPQVTQGNASI